MHATTPETNLPPVSTTPAANFASGTAGVVNTVLSLSFMLQPWTVDIDNTVDD